MIDIVDEYEDEMNSLHEKAMNVAEEGFFLQRAGKIEEAKQKYYSAFLIEREVADMLGKSKKKLADIEPSRSIISLSAAQLALDAGYFDEAKKYANLVVGYNFNDEFVEDAHSILKSETSIS